MKELQCYADGNGVTYPEETHVLTARVCLRLASGHCRKTHRSTGGEHAKHSEIGFCPAQTQAEHILPVCPPTADLRSAVNEYTPQSPQILVCSNAPDHARNGLLRTHTVSCLKSLQRVGVDKPTLLKRNGASQG
jgi:hypothetical protein